MRKGMTVSVVIFSPLTSFPLPAFFLERPIHALVFLKGRFHLCVPLPENQAGFHKKVGYGGDGNPRFQSPEIQQKVSRSKLNGLSSLRRQIVKKNRVFSLLFQVVAGCSLPEFCLEPFSDRGFRASRQAPDRMR